MFLHDCLLACEIYTVRILTVRRHNENKTDFLHKSDFYQPITFVLYQILKYIVIDEKIFTE